MMQVPIPLVPSNFSLQTAPVQRPADSNVASSATDPRRSTTSPPPSANSTEQPTPPTARSSRLSVLWATLSNRPRRSCAATTSPWVSRREGAWFVGSSACKWPERRHEAASPEFAMLPPARTSKTLSAWTAPSERPMLSPSQRRQRNGYGVAWSTSPYITLKTAPLIRIKEASMPPRRGASLWCPSRISLQGTCRSNLPLGSNQHFDY